jgi:hypothetical protein
MFKNNEASSSSSSSSNLDTYSSVTYKLSLPKGLGDEYATQMNKISGEVTFGKPKSTIYINESNFDTKIIDFTSTHSQKPTFDSSIVVILDRQTSASHFGNDEEKGQIMTTSLNPLTSIEKQQVEAIMTQIHDRTEEEFAQTIEELTPQLPKMNKFKIDQLREMCKMYGLPTTGTKDVLFKRLKSGNFLK